MNEQLLLNANYFEKKFEILEAPNMEQSAFLIACRKERGELLSPADVDILTGYLAWSGVVDYKDFVDRLSRGRKFKIAFLEESDKAEIKEAIESMLDWLRCGNHEELASYHRISSELENFSVRIARPFHSRFVLFIIEQAVWLLNPESEKMSKDDEEWLVNAVQQKTNVLKYWNGEGCDAISIETDIPLPESIVKRIWP